MITSPRQIALCIEEEPDINRLRDDVQWSAGKGIRTPEPTKGLDYPERATTNSSSQILGRSLESSAFDHFAIPAGQTTPAGFLKLLLIFLSRHRPVIPSFRSSSEPRNCSRFARFFVGAVSPVRDNPLGTPLAHQMRAHPMDCGAQEPLIITKNDNKQDDK
jgi:hypothetical protein